MTKAVLKIILFVVAISGVMVEFESLRLRQNWKSESEAEMGSARSADTNAFPPKNPESKRVFHAPRGSKSTVRSLI
jgi:hypothetical protein